MIQGSGLEVPPGAPARALAQHRNPFPLACDRSAPNCMVDCNGLSGAMRGAVLALALTVQAHSAYFTASCRSPAPDTTQIEGF